MNVMTINTIEIDNAGLVLLVPFLPRLFRNLGYLGATRFADAERQVRALCLMQYMVDKNSNPAADLSLNRLLCGMLPEDAVSPLPDLTAMEKQAADEILEAMMAHWMLKDKMTTDELRQLFLKRHATLHPGMPSVVRVAPFDHDWMLGELPWVYRSVRTPWSETIAVQWND